MKKLTLILIYCALLIGCASFEKLESGLSNLEGKHIDTAINKLGYPHDESMIVGKKFYYWFNEEAGTYYAPESTDTYGYVDDKPVHFSTNTTRIRPYYYFCKIRIFVDNEDIIINSDYQGSIEGCQVYTNKLKPPKSHAN